MEQTIQLPIEYKGADLDLEARVQVWQYGFRFFVPVDDIELTFEKDDFGEYRAIVPEGHNGKLPDRELVAAIIEVLNALEL